MANYLALSDIYGQIELMLTDYRDGNRRTELKAAINMVYLLEMLNCDDLFPCLWFLAFLDDSVKCKDSATITGITAATPPVVTSAAHGYANGDIIQIAGVVGMTELNNRVFVVADRAVNTFELQTLDGTDIVGAGYTAWTSGGTVYHRGISLASGYEKVLTAAWHGYNGEMKEIDEKELERTTSWWDPATSGLPTRYLQKKYFTAAGVEANRILWFPRPDDNYPMRAWLQKQADRLSANTDVPILPYQYHDGIIAGTIARLTQYPQIQIENAVVWPGIYKAHLEALKNENRKWWKRFNKEQRSGYYLA